MTVEQYLEIERLAEFRSEYISGEVSAMPGGTLNHALIAAGVLQSLYPQLLGRPCSAAGSDLRVWCEQAEILTYPDVTVFCEPARLKDKEKDTLTDATLIVEVLSPSTKSYDGGDKFSAYRSLKSFSEYLLPEQDRIAAEHHVRQEDGSWLLREHAGPDTLIELRSIGCDLRLGDPYLKAIPDAPQP